MLKLLIFINHNWIQCDSACKRQLSSFQFLFCRDDKFTKEMSKTITVLVHSTLQVRRSIIYNWFVIILIIFLLFIIAEGSLQARVKPKITRSNEYKIKRLILRHYDKTTRPVRNDSTPIAVHIAISLYHILDTVRLIQLVVIDCYFF